MAQDLDLDDVVEHFTLVDEELDQLRNKAGATRLGFALMLKFLLWKGRFPRGRHELADNAVEHVSRQVGVPASEFGSYDIANRTAQRHRTEVRRHTGFRQCSVADAEKLAFWLAGHVAESERREDRVRGALLGHCRTELIEPPSTDRVTEIVRSALHQAEQALVTRVVARLDLGVVDRLEALIARDHDPDLGHDNQDVLSQVKATPGNVSLDSVLVEVAKLDAVRSVGLPVELFSDVSPKVISGWRARASVESPSHLREHSQPTRLVLLTALMFEREREITDALVELLISTVHRINARAEKKVVEEFTRDFRRITGKDSLLRQIAEASLEAPDHTVRQVIYPVVGGESTLHDLIAEYKASGSEYQRSKRRVFKASYTGHYRRGLIKLLRALEFRSNNTTHQPVVRALGVIVRHADSRARFYPPDEVVVLDGVIGADWEDLVVEADSRGRSRVVRTVYEACVLQALRERLRSKEIWVVGAHEWRNPDEDLPVDFEANRVEHYAMLRKPLDPGAFVAELREELQSELKALHTALPDLDWLDIADRKSGAIRLTPVPAQPEPVNLRRLKKAVRARWGTVPLIDVLKEAALRTGMLTQFAPISSREAMDRDTLWERLLLVAYAYGTNTGIGAVSDQGHSESDLRYVARRYFTLDGARAVAVELANATFAARQHGIWGQGTTTVASDSTHFRSYDQNLFTEWHSRYGGRGVLIYWHVEKKSMVVHSQLLSCSASEVAAMVEGAVRHGTSMQLEGNYVDSHGQSEIGFGITRLLGFDLLPRIKRINRIKLYRPERSDTDAFPLLQPAMTRAIRWDLIEQNYDLMIKYATAIRVGTASAEAILRRFTRNASHPAYQAMLEVGRAQRTIFACRYLRHRDLQREIEEGLNVVESWNRVNGVIFYGKLGEFATNRRDQQELGMLALHILQAAIVYVNTLMVQEILALPEWDGVLTTEDKRGLTPLFWKHILPYGEVKLNMTQRLPLTEPAPAQASAG